MSPKLLAALTMMAVIPGTTSAQSRWAFEIRGGAAFATQDLADASLGTGFGFEGTIAYRFQPHLSAYAGWDWHRFPADASLAGADSDFDETGYAFGLLFEHPIGNSEALAIELRGGGTYNHMEVENSAGDLVTDTGHGLGYEAGAGLALRLNDAWRATPGVRFRSLSRDLEAGGVSTAADLRYVALEVGFSHRF
jgi:outer membrane protein with beta-barrel domain